MPTTTLSPDLAPRRGRGRRFARAAGQVATAAVVAFATCGLALFVAAPMLAGSRGPPGVPDRAPEGRAPVEPPPAGVRTPSGPRQARAALSEEARAAGFRK